MRGNSGIIGKSTTPALSSASGVHGSFDQYNARVDNKWPKVKSFVSISPNTANHLEGEPKTFTVVVGGYENGDTVYYSLSVSVGVNATDFAGGQTSGSFTVNSSGQGSFTITERISAPSGARYYHFIPIRIIIVIFV